MKNMIKKIGLSLYGLLQGTVGSYIALLGVAFAFPQSSPGSKDYEEDMFFVPLGFIIMLMYLAIMITTFVLLRKSKANLLVFIIPWLIGVAVYIFWGFFIY